MAEIDCNGLDEPCVTWTGGVTRTGPRQYKYKVQMTCEDCSGMVMKVLDKGKCDLLRYWH